MCLKWCSPHTQNIHVIINKNSSKYKLCTLKESDKSTVWNAVSKKGGVNEKNNGEEGFNLSWENVNWMRSSGIGRKY